MGSGFVIAAICITDTHFCHPEEWHVASPTLIICQLCLYIRFHCSLVGASIAIASFASNIDTNIKDPKPFDGDSGTLNQF